ncbi:hypothetical protein DYB28_002090 [Aphanomyces astaci]|uniref:PDZ domain-containing protein n=1 Tax=Aphanomyces astaci TaxID=112090 RepID=A0A397EEC2_APHAT|nr:hypothetical protein DYB25_000032 [Aphanomyces astaci]RHY69591.1 hypothetical protein DYB38_000854 [Aphanomyces astaci]RHY72076.1 hypothetical protein DYB34_002134 [Aphanomyces astaci]RHY78554.1 hypothetical protein DYB30_000040 [Aphanomyces astaci]RHZ14417.1 hypothetical protein DYB31_002543 [Aphanomyces astaci]
MLRCACLCNQDDNAVGLTTRRRNQPSSSPSSPSSYARFSHEAKTSLESFQLDNTVSSSSRPSHKDTIDSPTLKDYTQHMASTTLASDWQEMRSRDVGHATATPVFLKKQPVSPPKANTPKQPANVSPARRDDRQVGSLYRTYSSSEVAADGDPHSIVLVRVPPGPTGLVLRPHTSAPVVVDGFEPVYTSEYPSGGPGPIESSDEDVGPGSLLVAIDNVSLLNASYADVVALLQATDGNAWREFVFQTYASE